MRITTSLIVMLALLCACGGVTTISCPDCEGTGVLVSETYEEEKDPGVSGSFRRSSSKKTCDSCDGAGKVKG